MSDDKKQLRLDILSKLALMTVHDKQSFDKTIVAHALDCLTRYKPKKVGIIWPFQNEPDIRTVADDPEYDVYLPIVKGDGQPMVYRRWRIGDHMRHGLQGTVEPVSGDETTELDFAFIPLVAVDWSGGRIGRGKGHFDRTLPVLRKNPNFKAIGVGYGLQVCNKDLPGEAHDAPLDGFITENGCVECG